MLINVNNSGWRLASAVVLAIFVAPMSLLDGAPRAAGVQCLSTDFSKPTAVARLGASSFAPATDRQFIDAAARAAPTSAGDLTRHARFYRWHVGMSQRRAMLAWQFSRARLH